MKRFRLGVYINRLIYGVFLLVLLIGVAANLTFSEKNYFFCPEAKWVLVGIISFGSLFCLLKRWLDNLSNRMLTIFLAVLFFAYVCFEIYLLREFTPSVIHDALRVRNDAFALANHSLPEWPVYYKLFSQNVLPTVLYAACFRALERLTQDPIFVSTIVSFVMSTTLFATLLGAVSVVSKKKSMVVLAACGLFFLPYLWMYNFWVLYTDTPLMIAWGVLALFWWRISSGEKQSKLMFSWWLLVSLPVFFLAQWTKASFLISGCFAVVYLVVHFLNERKLSWKLGIATVGLLGVLVAAFCSVAPMEKRVHFFPEDQFAFPIEHWISMGWNQHSKGRYEFDDMIEIKDLFPEKEDASQIGEEAPPIVDEKTAKFMKEEKKKFAKERLKKRILEEEPRRIFWQLINKVGVLLYGGDTFSRYYQGFQKAPGWFQRHVRGIWWCLGYLSQVTLSLIYLFAIGKVWRAFLRGSSEFLVPVLVVLAVVLFYALLWEVSPRYAEVILAPLLIILSIPSGAAVEQLKWKTKVGSVLIFSFILFCSSKALGAQTASQLEKAQVEKSEKPKKETVNWVPVIGNASNYMMMYGRKNLEIPPKRKISQKVVVNEAIYQRLRVERKEKQRGIFTVKYKGKTIFTAKDFQEEERFIAIDREVPFEKGEYELIWENPKSYPIRVIAQMSSFYPLAEFPLTGFDMGGKYYLIYDFNVKEK